VGRVVQKSKRVTKHLARHSWDNRWLLLIVLAIGLLVLINLPRIADSFQFADETGLQQDEQSIAVPAQVLYSGTSVQGYVESDQQLCLKSGKPLVMIFGKQDHTWTQNALHVVEDALSTVLDKVAVETLYMGSMSKNRQAVFEAFNPTQSYPTVLVACKYMKIGMSSRSESDVNALKEIIERVVV